MYLCARGGCLCGCACTCVCIAHVQVCTCVCAHLQQISIKDFSHAQISLLFWAWLFEENEWIQDQEPFWRNLSLFEDYDFFILYKASRESYMLALGGPAYQRIPDGDIDMIKPRKDIIVVSTDLQNKQGSLKLSRFTPEEQFIYGAGICMSLKLLQILNTTDLH